MGNPAEAALEAAPQRPDETRGPHDPNPGYGTLAAGAKGLPHPFASHKGICTAYALWLPPLGLFGAHHFYLHRFGFGLLYFFTFGLFGVGWLVDAFRMHKLVAKANKRIQNPHVPDEPCLEDAYLLWFPLGIFGAHHFYLRRYGFGVLYLLSFGLFGIGWIFDLFRMPKLVTKTRDDQTAGTRNYRSCDAYVLTACPITGLLGFQHYYLNRPGIGLVYTLTLGLFGIGWLVDLCRMPSLIRDAERRQREGDDRQKRLDDAFLLWCPPAGLLGLHHYYLERPFWGCLYTLTFGLFGIGWLIDICRIRSLVKEINKWIKNCRDAQNGLGPSQIFPGPQYPTSATSGVILSVPHLKCYQAEYPPAYPAAAATATAPAYPAVPMPPPYPGTSEKNEDDTPVPQDPRQQTMRHQFV